MASGLSRVWSRTAARLAGVDRVWAANAAASNLPGPVGRGSEMVRLLKKIRSFGVLVCAGLFLSYGGNGWLNRGTPPGDVFL